MDRRRKDLSLKLARTADHTRMEAIRRLSPSADVLTREYLCHAYLDEERDICAIAREVGCRPGTVLFHLAVLGIPLRPPVRRMINPVMRRDELGGRDPVEDGAKARAKARAKGRAKGRRN